MQDDNAVQYWNINEITTVQFNFETNEILTTLIKFPMAPQYLSSRAETICNNIVHVFGGYMAQESRITAKPDISSTLFAFDLDKLVCPQSIIAYAYSTPFLSRKYAKR